MGWMHWDYKLGRYKQKMKKQGRGTKKIDVNKTADKEELIQGTKYFFEKGKCKYGPVDAFSFKLMNYTQEEVHQYSRCL